MRLTLQRAADLDPRGSLGARLQMRLARLAGDDAEARRRHLEKALQLDPQNGEALDALLEQAKTEQRWDQVVALMEAAAERATDEEARRTIQLDRVDIFTSKLADHEMALHVLAGIYAQVNDDIEVNRRIADALYASGRLEEAGGMFHWLVEMSADKRSKRRGHFLTRLARIEIQLGQVDEAQKRLEEAYRLDTTNVETLIALGSLHEANKKWAEALKIYRSMLLQNADKSGHIRRGDIYLCLARTHMGLSEKSKAQAMLRRGVEEDPTHDELRKMLEELGG
jgi:tetratricopeptide (TPR) repeat protein